MKSFKWHVKIYLNRCITSNEHIVISKCANEKNQNQNKKEPCEFVFLNSYGSVPT